MTPRLEHYSQTFLNPNLTRTLTHLTTITLTELSILPVPLLPVTIPLIAMIDYRGYRLLAMSILPIDSQRTLRYGSEDGGKTVVSGLNKEAPFLPLEWSSFIAHFTP